MAAGRPQSVAGCRPHPRSNFQPVQLPSQSKLSSRRSSSPSRNEHRRRAPPDGSGVPRSVDSADEHPRAATSLSPTSCWTKLSNLTSAQVFAGPTSASAGTGARSSRSSWTRGTRHLLPGGITSLSALSRTVLCPSNRTPARREAYAAAGRAAPRSGGDARSRQ
ncbi:hypothetical protein PAHAL_1G206400 [Panicum hallii]|uniref:Uncharacterized protein n=1 Tax=Panicum hallii TaxID=206008 RepID=A0A2S3GPN1_9POAL|nr:hypothetical protein PAHAL_1G206400 [Panicum hallii]